MHEIMLEELQELDLVAQGATEVPQTLLGTKFETDRLDFVYLEYVITKVEPLHVVAQITMPDDADDPKDAHIDEVNQRLVAIILDETFEDAPVLETETDFEDAVLDVLHDVVDLSMLIAIYTHQYRQKKPHCWMCGKIRPFDSDEGPEETICDRCAGLPAAEQEW